jgi:glutathione synthase/RimK-type ligase-like ATP-grasp enzyme
VSDRVDVRLVTCAHSPAPDPDTPLLAQALQDAGVTVEVAGWRDPGVDWAGARVTVLRSPWDYVDALDEFVAWTRATGTVTRLWNPPELVAWNVHKSYLLELASRGAPVVPTIVLPRGAAAALDGICDAQGWNCVVVKPAVGIGASGAGRFDVGDPAGQLHLDRLLEAGDALVQRFVPSVTSEGEFAVVLADGEPTHAVRKVPGQGDFRVHEQWGGRAEPAVPSDALADLAARACAALPEPPLYARVDALRLGGLWHVLEVEVTEPRLWLDLAPASATRRFAGAVMARLR